MKLKTLMIAGSIALAALCPASAQQQTPPPGSSEPRPAATNRVGRIATELKLTDTQKAQFTAALKTQGEQARQIRQDSSLTPDERRDKVKAVREQFQKQLKQILTAEQFEKWQKLQAENRAKASKSPNSAE